MNFPFINRYNLNLEQVFWGPLLIALYFYLEFLFPSDDRPANKIMGNIAFFLGLIFASTIMGLFKYQLLQFKFQENFAVFFASGALAGLTILYGKKQNIKISKLFLLNAKALLCMASFIIGLIILSAIQRKVSL